MATFWKFRSCFLNRKTGKAYLRLHHPLAERRPQSLFSRLRVASEKPAIAGNSVVRPVATKPVPEVSAG
jgi:hypothetical protein